MCKPWALTVYAILWTTVALPAAESNPFQPQSGDWPQWRGPQRDGVCRETGLLQTWPAQGPPVAWKAKGLGTGFSGVAVASGRIFGLSVRGDDEVAWALDETDGHELWSTRFAEAKPTKNPQYKNIGPRSTPTVDGHFLYVLGVSGDLACLDVAEGKLRWHKNLPSDFGGLMPGWGYSESPLVDGHRLVCTPGGNQVTLVALNKESGEVLWKASVPQGDAAAYSSVVVSEAGGLREYVQLLARGLVGIAADEGKFLWRYDKVANGVANIPTPIIKDNLVFASTGYQGGSVLLRLAREGDGIKAEELYFLPAKVLQNHHGGLVVVNDYIYGGHGHNNGFPICVKLASGEVMWRKDRGPGSGSAAVLYADQQLYFRYQNGIMALIQATPARYKLNGTFKLPDISGQPSWPHPVIANGKLYVRDQDVLLCYDVKQH